MAANRSKARKPKARKSKASADPTIVPGQNPVSRLKALGGGDSDQWNSRIGHRLFAALPGLTSGNASEAGRATLSGLLEINSTDPIEAAGYAGCMVLAAAEMADAARYINALVKNARDS
jgi:hypothetical protein